MASPKANEPQITKRRVTMRGASSRILDDGTVESHVIEAVDYVRPDFLDAYVADARTRWDSVTVSDEPDAGPGGYHGQTAVPESIDHPLAGQVFAATKEG